MRGGSFADSSTWHLRRSIIRYWWCATNAAEVIGLRRNTASLDGAWRIDPKPGQDVREKLSSATNWGNFDVPGQWVEQGYDIVVARSSRPRFHWVITLVHDYNSKTVPYRFPQTRQLGDRKGS